MKTTASEGLQLVCDEARLLQYAETVLQRCERLAAYSEQEGGILRTFLSPAMARCNGQVRTWMEAAGMQVGLDTAGNLRGLLVAADADAPTLILVSHLDTVPNAGKYDGILGVMIGVALVEAVHEQRLPFHLEVIGFSDEEGVRYGLPFLGSRGLTGTLERAHLRLTDADGISLDAALREFREQHPEALRAAVLPNAAACVEFHIEQGPVLESADVSLAVVASIAGQSRATISFEGRAGHAGTTPMSLRRDALMAAAEWLLVVERMAAAMPGVVATCGRILCEPGASNIIPGLVRCTLDVRSPSDMQRVEPVNAMLAAASEIALRRQVQASHTLDYALPSVALHPSLSALAAACMQPDERLATPMVSGAGHDAMILAPYLPTAMIFLRSPGGISHHPDESVLPGDVVAALRTGLRLLQAFPAWTDGEAVRKQVASCTT